MNHSELLNRRRALAGGLVAGIGAAGVCSQTMAHANKAGAANPRCWLQFEDLIVKDGFGNTIPVPAVPDLEIDALEARTDGITRRIQLYDGRSFRIFVPADHFRELDQHENTAGVLRTVWKNLTGANVRFYDDNGGRMSISGWYIRVQAGISG
jgi:hypothetical protein